jgi:hypothetical protein
MNRTLLVAFAILTISASAASAWTDRTDESHATKPHAFARAMNANAAMIAPGNETKRHKRNQKSGLAIALGKRGRGGSE